MNYEGYSLADIAAATGNSGGGNNDGFGDGNGAWLIILFLIFAAFGWGNNGNNRGGNNCGGSSGGYSGVADNYVLATDFATIERKLDSVNSGLCDGFYAMAQQFSNTNQNIFNGNAGLQQTLCQGFSGVNTALVQQGYETRLGTQSLASQLANCCCDIRQEIADCCCKTQANIKDVSYNIAMGNNALQNTLCNTTRDIIENQNANYRALHDEIIANKIEMKNDRIAEQQNEINALRLAASQERQNNYLVSKLGQKCPEPAYIVPNPSCCYNYNVTGVGYGNNCGCGC